MWQQRTRFGHVICLSLLASVFATAARPGRAVVLGIDGSRFTVDGKPTFLLGVSYYGALSAPRRFVRQDLDGLRAKGFNWVRVWATWRAGDVDVSAVSRDGSAREPYLSRLIWLVRQADRRRIVVDVTLSRGDFLPTQDAHLAAAEVLAQALAPFGNVYFDLANERDVRDARYVGFEELRQLRDEVKHTDPDRLVTASGDSDPGAYLRAAALDFFSPHLGRDAGAPDRTADAVRGYLARMRDLGCLAPVHLQEPMRRDYGRWQPVAADFLTDLRGALAGGAAGWCLHNGGPKGGQEGPPRCFDMSQRRLLHQLDPEELAVVDAAPGIVRERWRAN